MYSTYFNLEISRAQRAVFAAVVAIALVVTPLFPLVAYADDTPSDPPQTQEGTEGDEGEGTGETVVETGDADSDVDVNNDVNANTVNTEAGDSETEEEVSEQTEEDAEQATTTPETIESPATTTPPVGTTTVTVTNENQATTTNAVGSEATTGDNEAAGGDGNAIIDTGDAIATANVINTINTNIVNSTGALYLLNRLFGGTLDLSSLFSSFGSGGGGNGACTLSTCTGSNTTYNVHSTSTAKITNDVVVRASTGGNSATSTGGGAYIQTGNAGAAANVVNVANTNIIDSNYLLVSLNNLGSLMGDIVLPGADFFTSLFGSSRSVGGNVSVSNNNEANVENHVSAGANTGGNMASSTDGATGISTGDASASANTTNVINTNLFGGTTIHFLFRVNGNWNGSVFGAPPGLSWAQTPNGLELYTDPDTELGGGSSTPISNMNVSNNNTADIENNVSVVALTGDNKAAGGDGGAHINTGNAYAGANVVNVVNTNVVGQNWILAVFNIMGDWNGNLSFGETDLWVGARAEGAMTPGSLVDFTLTVSNLGNAAANNATLDASFNNDLFELQGDEDLAWSLGTVPAGATVERTFQARIVDGLPGGQFPVELIAVADSYEPDVDDSNNSDHLSLVVDNGEFIEFYNLMGDLTPASDLQITKSVSVSTTTVPATVDYTIVIKNQGGPAYHSELVDVLVDANDNVIHEQVWPLDTIFADEEITITYSVEFDGATNPGLYTNYAQVYAITQHPSLDPFYGTFGDSPEVAATIFIEGEEAPEPVVARTPDQCYPLLTSYLRDGQDNDPAEVQKLQRFLRDQGYSSVLVTGLYDAATQAAVTDYQEAHADEILEPWGAPSGTGYVYYTTQKHINEAYCEEEFPLTERQLAEIRRLKARIEDLRDVSGQPVIPPNAPIGLAEPAPTPTYSAAPPNPADTQAAAAAAALGGGSELAAPRTIFDSVIDALRNLFGRANGDHVSVR